MDCDLFKEKIEGFVYEKNIRPDDEMIRHISGCPDCQAWLKSCQRARKITSNLSQIEPVISDPQQFTSDILLAVDELEPKATHPKIHFLTIAKKFLVAASTLLFVVFAYEQYVFVNKLIKLEADMSASPKVRSDDSFYKKVIAYYPDKGMQMVRSELAAQSIESKKMNFKSLIMTAGYSVLSSREIMKQTENQSFLDQNLSKKTIQ